MKQPQHRFNQSLCSLLLLIPFLFTLGACDGPLDLPDLKSKTPAEDTLPRDTINQPEVNTPDPAEPSTPKPQAPKNSPPNVKETQSDSVNIYWLSSKDNDLALLASPLELEEPNSSNQDKITQALERLLKGPANANVSTAIPAQTKLYKVTIKEDGVHINLSKDFTSGGGSSSMQGRLGQVIYTASSLNPQTPIWISIEGEALQVLGGEGLEVPQPMTRKEFDSSFSI